MNNWLFFKEENPAKTTVNTDMSNGNAQNDDSNVKYVYVREHEHMHHGHSHAHSHIHSAPDSISSVGKLQAIIFWTQEKIEF